MSKGFFFSAEKKQKTFDFLRGGSPVTGARLKKFFGSFFQKRTAFLLLLAGANAPVSAAVNIDNFTFATPVLTVAAGTRVVWTNRDDIPHTVTSVEDPRGTRSPPLDTGDSYARVFPTTGTYHYFCSLHPRMTGIVVVK